MNSKVDTRLSKQQGSYSYMPVITTIAVPLLLGYKKESDQQDAAQEAPPKPKPHKPTGLAVTKYEIAEEKLKFSNLRGLFKKRWVVVKEFPIYEITVVESLGNWLSLTWNDEVHSFVLKQKTESFAKLAEQIQGLHEEHQRTLQKNTHAALRRSELLSAINATLPIIDSAFDILMGLHEKRVNWTLLEEYTQALGSGLSFKAETLTPLNLDFAKVAAAVKNQTPQETAKETFSTLKTIHEYFNTLKPEDDLADTTPNFSHAKGIVSAYFTLNDLWFAKIVGETDNKKEFSAFEAQLQVLADQTGFKAGVEEFKQGIEGADAEGDGVLDSRLLFKERLKQL
jgi:hypothetical protein